MFFAVLPFPTFRIWIVIAFIHFTGSSSRTRTTLTKTLFEKWTLMQKWVANWRTQFNEYCYGWWAAVVAVAPVGTLQSNTVMDLLNWFWFYGISVNMLRSYLWFRFFLLIRTWYLYLSLCCAVLCVCFFAVVVIFIASVLRFQRCLNLLAAWIELRFLIAATHLYMLHLLDETQSLCEFSIRRLCEWMCVCVYRSLTSIHK